MTIRHIVLVAALISGLLLSDVAPASASSFPTFHPDLSVGITASMGVSHRKRVWHPNGDTPSLRTPLSVYLVPSLALLRGIRFAIGLGLHSLEPPLTFGVMPSFKFFPFHPYAFKSPMTRRRGGKWVPPNPITGLYFRPVFVVTLGSIGIKDKEDADGDATDQAGTPCLGLDPAILDACIERAARDDKAGAPLIFGGGLGIGFHFRGEGKEPEPPEAPGGGEGLTDWRYGDPMAGPEAPTPTTPAPPELPEPEAPEAPKPPAVGFDIEVLAMLLKHGTRGFNGATGPVPPRYIDHITGLPLGLRDYTSTTTTQCIAGTVSVANGGTGNAWIADCEQNAVEFRIELRLSIIIFPL